MFFGKKIINTHLLHLALIVTFLRFDPDVDPTLEWSGAVPEVHEILLGQSSAYIQTNFHNIHNEVTRYVSPKNIDAVLDGSSLFAELNSLGRHSRFVGIRNDVVAYLASNQEHRSQDPSQQSSVSGTTDEISAGDGDVSAHPGENVQPRQVSFDESEAENSSQSGRHGACLSSNAELSPEDMGLIEILWKQDIDLGIGIDVFENRDLAEKEKLKINDTKDEKAHDDDFHKKKPAEPVEEPDDDPWKGLSYTIDSETGEHIFYEPSSEGRESVGAEEDMFGLNDEDLKHLAEELENLPLEEAFSLWEPQVNKNNTNNTKDDNEDDFKEDKTETEVPSNDDVEDSLDLSYGIENYEESLFEEIEKLEKMMKSEEETTKDGQEVNEIYPSVEDWQDFSNPLSASLLNSTSHSHVASSQMSSLVRPGALYPQSSDGLIPLSSNAHSSVEDAFPGVLLQNASLIPPVADVSSHYAFATSNIGSSNIGSAVVASMAALANDSDPITDGMMGVTYSPEFPEFLYLPNASGTVQGEYLLSQLLADEDLRLMDINASTEAGNCNPPTTAADDHMDTSSDSAVSSMGPDRVPSISDGEWIDSCSESSSHPGDHEHTFPLNINSSPAVTSDMNNSHHQFPSHHPVAQKKYKLFGKKTINSHDGFQHENDSIGFSEGSPSDQFVKNPQYLLLKEHPEENCPSNFYSMIDGATGLHARNQTYSSNDPPNLSSVEMYTNHLHHNHTYHLPFGSDGSPKPVMREKAKSLMVKSEADRITRDEKKARTLKIPLTTPEIINLPIDEFNEKMSKFDLTEHQITLIRDIRRRGKNKVAAQNCRKRKMDQIVGLQHEVDNLQLEKDQLEAERNHMLFQRRLAQDKYAQLYQLVLQVTNLQPSGPPDFFPQLGQNRDGDTHMLSNSSSFDTEPESETSKGTRAKRKMDKK